MLSANRCRACVCRVLCLRVYRWAQLVNAFGYGNVEEKHEAGRVNGNVGESNLHKQKLTTCIYN